MGFWIFMLLMDMMIPIMMLLFGWYFKKFAPGNINNWFGYRTTMSKKNVDTWQFAHKLFGQWWWRCGWIALLSIIPLFFVVHGTEDTIGIVGGIICMVQCVIMLIPIPLVEIALRKTFDSDGNRRTK